MNTVCEEKMCAGCMACVETCPRNAISIVDEIEYYNAVIDDSNCVKCGACHNVCQRNHKPALHKPAVWYQGWSQDDGIRAGSSSGGLGVALLKAFVEKYGSVCACVYRDGSFRFEFADSVEEIGKFSGSKYVKSNPSGIFKKIKEFLRKGEKLLFVGLPCQVAAVKNFVGRDLSENLYTVDLICHGSPSPRLLELYLSDRQGDLKKIRKIQFRKKNRFHLYCDDKPLMAERVCDMYTTAFLEGLDYTDNCYSCDYARVERVADITIGDSWGSELDINEQRKGISLILCQTEKGEKLVQDANLHLEDVNIEKATKANHQLNYPSPMHDQRKRFFREIRNGSGFSKAVSRCMPKVYYKEKLKLILVKMRLLSDR